MVEFYNKKQTKKRVRLDFVLKINPWLIFNAKDKRATCCLREPSL